MTLQTEAASRTFDMTPHHHYRRYLPIACSLLLAFFSLLPCTALHFSNDTYSFPDGSIEEAAVQRDVDICTIIRIDARTFTQQRFFHEFYQRRPFILTHYHINSGHFRHQATLESLLSTYGDEEILTASANTYSHKRMPMSFRSYVNSIRSGPLTLENEADTTAYFFGDHDDANQWESDEEFDRAMQEEEEEKQARKRRLTECLKQALTLPQLDLLAECRSNEALLSKNRNKMNRPIWAKLLRQYSPPSYVIPTTNTREANEQLNRSGIESPDEGIRRTKLDASDLESQRLLFAAGDSPATLPASSSTLPPRYSYLRYSFGLGGHRSGVPFHFHGAAIGEVLHGRKRWFLYPPNPKVVGFSAATKKMNMDDDDSTLPFPSFRPELTQLQWLTHIYPTLSPSDRPLQCTLGPDELIYVPGNFYHATMNLGEVSIFLSTFVDEGRMEAVMREHGMDMEKLKNEKEPAEKEESTERDEL